MSVFPWFNDTNTEFEFGRDAGCDKMSLCSSVQQGALATFRAYDNRQRDNAALSALIHIGQESSWLQVEELDDYLYEFTFTHREKGVAILEVYVDDIQIPESPFRVEIIARDCDIDFPGQRMSPVSCKLLVKNSNTSFPACLIFFSGRARNL